MQLMSLKRLSKGTIGLFLSGDWTLSRFGKRWVCGGLSNAMTPCGSTPMTSARWSGGSRVSASSSHDRISAARGLSLGSSVNSAAALGLISFAMRMPRKRTRMHLRGASGDLTHHATILKRIESAAPAGLASPARPDGGPPSPRRLLKKDHAPTYYGRDLLYLRTGARNERRGCDERLRAEGRATAGG